MSDKQAPLGKIPDDACRSPIELIPKVVVCDTDHSSSGLTSGFDNTKYHQAHGGYGPGEIEWHIYWKHNPFKP